MQAPNLVEQVTRALVLYSMAEAQLGHASVIAVELSGHRFSVEDDGRGHGVARTIEGAPYLQFVYNHLDYPFEGEQSKPIQLQGLGMSLINAVCSELSVHVRKPTGQLRMEFRSAKPVAHEYTDTEVERTGNTIGGCIDNRYEARPADVQAFSRWLAILAAVHPTVLLRFNGQNLQVSVQSAA